MGSWIINTCKTMQSFSDKKKNKHHVHDGYYCSTANAWQIFRNILNVPQYFEMFTYSRSKSTKSPASGTGNVNKPRLMSQVGKVHKIVWALKSVSYFLEYHPAVFV
jgi:hypothetical protein